jgi:hypothetical protein
LLSFTKYRDHGRIYRFTLRIHYLLAVGFAVGPEPSSLKFLLSFRKRPRLKMERRRLLDFEGVGLILREADV